MKNQATTDDLRDTGDSLQSRLASLRPPAGIEDKFRALAESLPQLIFSCDSAGKKDYCCQRYLDYTGFQSCDEIDRGWLTILHPSDREKAEAAWKKAMVALCGAIQDAEERWCVSSSAGAGCSNAWP